MEYIIEIEKLKIQSEGLKSTPIVQELFNFVFANDVKIKEFKSQYSALEEELRNDHAEILMEIYPIRLILAEVIKEATQPTVSSVTTPNQRL